MSSRRVRFVLFRAVLLILVAWATIVLGFSGFYVRALTHPGCWRAETAPQGFQSVTLITTEGASLKGWWSPPRNGVVVVLQAGHGGSRDAMMGDAYLLARHGFGALSLDTRSCSGLPATMGAREVEDLRAGVQFAYTQPGVRKVAALGFSAGAVSVIRGTAQIPEIQAVIAEGNYYSMWGEIANTNAKPLSWGWQVEHGVAAMILLQVGVWPPAVSPIDALPHIAPRPVLLIHGEREEANNHAQQQYEAAGDPRALWIVRGAGHGGYLQAQPQEYERRIIEFLEKLVE